MLITLYVESYHKWRRLYLKVFMLIVLREHIIDKYVVSPFRVYHE